MDEMLIANYLMKQIMELNAKMSELEIHLAAAEALAAKRDKDALKWFSMYDKLEKEMKEMKEAA